MSPRALAPKLPAVGTLVAILWEDASFSLDEHVGTLELITVGWITKIDRKAVTVAGEQSSSGDDRRSYTSIPRSLVRLVRELA